MNEIRYKKDWDMYYKLKFLIRDLESDYKNLKTEAGRTVLGSRLIELKSEFEKVKNRL